MTRIQKNKIIRRRKIYLIIAWSLLLFFVTYFILCLKGVIPAASLKTDTQKILVVAIPIFVPLFIALYLVGLSSIIYNKFERYKRILRYRQENIIAHHVVLFIINKDIDSAQKLFLSTKFKDKTIIQFLLGLILGGIYFGGDEAAKIKTNEYLTNFLLLSKEIFYNDKLFK